MSHALHADAEPDDVEVWRPSRAEWRTYIDDGLRKLDLTWEELARQARERDFESSEARDFWVVVGGTSA